MAGTDNHGALMEDWMPPSHSPRILMSCFLNEEFSYGSFPKTFNDDSSSKRQDGIDKSKTFFDSSGEETVQETKAFLQFDSNEKSTSNGGLAERMAARTGFGVLKIDTSHVSSSAPVRSPVTIPPGVSPRELLESPVFLPNASAQPSPTTGKLPFLMRNHFKSTTPSFTKKAEESAHDNSAFCFQPIYRSKLPSFLNAEKGPSIVHQNQASADYNHQQEPSLQSNSTGTKDATDANLVKPKTCDSNLDNDHPSPTDEEEESEESQNGEHSSALVTAPPEDGYNWRKYGQKQVKNSEYPRSYYKCTHPDCPVKKKVERSQDGHITEIVYNGSHSHPSPQPNRQPSFNDLQADGQEDLGSKPGQDAAASLGSTPNGHTHDVHCGVLETKMTGYLVTTDLANTSAMESREAMDVSKDDEATHGSIPLNFDGENADNESKRRKMDVSATTNNTTSTFDVAAMASRAVREPRIIVQTTSEVDILDDGYRWRKYGQKVVKGNTNPRSYYKCTHAGCGVRKHVERASNDLKSVITSYEGKHNHEVPAARNSRGHPSSAQEGCGNLHQMPQLAQASIVQFSGVPAFGSVSLPAQLGAGSGGFCFGMFPPGMAVPVPPGAAVPAVPMRVPRHTSAMQHCPGVMLPRGEVKVNPKEQSSLPVATRSGTATYHQIMGRLPQGPQM